jgi:large repetitive protein
MRTSTLKLSLLTLIMCLGLTAFAQQNSYYNYNYPWTFGINGGLEWQYSDVNGGAGYGFGMDLAKRVGGNPNSWFALDFRGRLEFARQYGQGYSRVYNLQDFSALSSGATNYTNIGYAFHNHQTTMGALDLEGVITLNRLRERTGWVVQGFGGIGVAWYNTMIDQTDGTSIYDYTTIDTTQSKGAIRRDIRGLRDRVYETEGSRFENGIHGAIMPSLGLGVGYQFTPRFSLGLEHKATWALADNLDAVVDATSPQPNDVHHYTSLYLRWTLGEEKGKEPIIEITAPNNNPYTVQVSTASIRANIKNVTRRSDVSVNLNGQKIDYFDFNTATEEFFLTVPLVDGKNTVTIYAQNEYGSDEESVIFIYEQQNNNGGGGNPTPNQNPPQVDITNPRNNPFSTDNNTINIEATINNITDRNSINYTVNGYKNTNFNYSGKNFTSTVTLQEGNNVIEISATNSRGEVRDTRTIVYTKTVVKAPIITFINPNRNPFETSDASFNVNATVQNVDNANKITFVVNNQSTKFDFKNGVLTSEINLQEGANVVNISANNEGGADNESTTIIYKKKNVPVLAPKVTITTPNGNPFNTDKAQVTVYAAIENVNNANEITFKVNGTTQKFNYSNGKFNADVNLVEGNNMLEVQANNNGGNATDFVNVFYRKANVAAPKVTVTTPAINPAVTFSTTEVITAVVTGVSSQNDILFKLNGSPNAKFSYSTSSNVFKATVNLNQGENTFEIIATNAGGTDKGEGKIVYKPQTTAQPPVITILNPATSPYTETNTFTNIQAKIENVSARENITLTVNGVSNTTFGYKNNILALQLNLVNGANTVVITANNADGNDSKSVVINYNTKPNVPKPVVSMVSPEKTPYTSNTAVYTVIANIQNVADKNEITVKVDGKAVTNFTYAKGNLKYGATIPTNGMTIEIIAENAGGKDSKTVVLNYVKPKQLPVITLINPTKSPATVTQPFIEFKAKIEHISGRNDIAMKVDGNPVPGFTFANDILTYAMDIPTAGSTIEITATNADGQDKETVIVNYNKPTPKPTITLRVPTLANVTTTNATEPLSVIIANVTDRNQITVTLNGTALNSYNFDTKSGLLTASLSLRTGPNVLIVTATNTGGTATQNINFNLKVANAGNPNDNSNQTQPTGDKPTIVFTTPATSNTTVTTNEYTVKAKLTNVTKKEDITIKLNGQVLKAYSYNAANGNLNFKTTLIAGDNTIIITANNSNGTTTQTTVIKLN